MGLAISCMHYAGLYALRLKPGIDALAQQEAPTHALLVFSIVGVVVLVFGLVLRSEEHTSELQSPCNLVCRLLLEKKKRHKSSHVGFRRRWRPHWTAVS